MEKKWQKTGQQAGIVHKILKIPESLLKKLVKFIRIGPPGGKATGQLHRNYPVLILSLIENTK